MEEYRHKLLIIVVMISLALSCSLFVSESSPAAGCNKSFGMGGCFGTTATLDITLEPEIECLEVEANNCNGGVLEFHNNCQDILTLGDFEIPPMEYALFDVVEEEDAFSLVEAEGNFSDFIPHEYKIITIDSLLGS